MIRIISDCSACAPALVPLTVLFLSSCGGGSTATGAAPATASGTSATASVPPCGIEGSGHAIPFSSCTPEGHQLGTMATARADHTATLLPDGKVLIAGGFGSGAPWQAVASAELYDPSTGVFTPTGSMTKARARHTAALLADGRVLIAGSEIDIQTGTYSASAEIYDPATGTFSATGNMISSGAVRSTLLPDNKIFIAEDGNAEVYDPASGTFALTGSYTSPTNSVDTATLLPNGSVLVVGCAAMCSIGTTELFNLKTGAFNPTGSRRAWGTVSTATLLMNGTVLFVEGNDSALPDDAEVYDPASGTFTHIGYTSAIHEFSTATRLPDGTVLIAGGQLPGGNGSPAAERYVPATGTFAPAGNMTTGRHEHTATLLPDGTVLIVGGYSFWPSPTANVEIYHPTQ
jgi:WD40 repeat protein